MKYANQLFFSSLAIKAEFFPIIGSLSVETHQHILRLEHLIHRYSDSVKSWRQKSASTMLPPLPPCSVHNYHAIKAFIPTGA